ncbi:MAG: deoxyribodipyrimidine photo-lyase, partial [Pseudomonadota bacterium]
MGSLLWFKRDLRVTDHAALAAAAEAGPVVALYVVEPAYWALPDTSARQWEFTRECVESLREALPVPLLVRVGQAVEVFEDLRASFDFDAIYSHEETGNGWTYQRDLAVRDWCAARGIAWHEFAQSGVVRRLKDRDGWAARRERYLRQPMIEGATPTGPHLEPGGIPT